MMFPIIQGSVFRVIDCESVHNRGHNLRLYKEHQAL